MADIRKPDDFEVNKNSAKEPRPRRLRGLEEPETLTRPSDALKPGVLHCSEVRLNIVTLVVNEIFSVMKCRSSLWACKYWDFYTKCLKLW